MKLGDIAGCYKIIWGRPGQLSLSDRRKKTINDETNPTGRKQTTITSDAKEDMLKTTEKQVKKEGSILASID